MFLFSKYSDSTYRKAAFRLRERINDLITGAISNYANHFHGIIILNDNTRRGGSCVRPNGDPKDRVEINPTPTTNVTIGDIICAFKSISTNRYINGVNMGLIPQFNKLPKWIALKLGASYI
jgi:hypothetical protein